MVKTWLTLLAVALLADASPGRIDAKLPKAAMLHTPEVDLSYLTFGAPGASVPLIVVNGGPGMPHDYLLQSKVWAQIGRTRLVVLYDQRGTGKSKRVRAGAPLSLDAQIADLDALRMKLGVNKVALLGDSFGGYLSMAYAAAHPDHVAKLVLSGSPPPRLKDLVQALPAVFPDQQEASAAQAKALGETTPEAVRVGIRNFLKMLFYSPAKREAFLRDVGELGYDPAVGNAVEKTAEGVDLTEEIKRFTHFPTLVLTGRYDMNVAPLNAWRIAHLIPGAKLVFFERSSHLPFYEEPAKYQKVVEAFLELR